jgi:hypothetical protein
MDRLTKGIARAIIYTAVCVAAAVLHVPAAYPHHSISMYDKTRTITLNGVIKRYEWANPHVYLTIVETTPTGTVDWELECESPGLLHRHGWLKTSLQVGDRITVTGYPHRDSSHKNIFPTLVLHGTRTLFDLKQNLERLASAGPPSNAVANGLDGTWVTLLNSPLVNGFMKPDPATLTPRGAEAVKHFDAKNKPVFSCVPYPPPFFMIFPDLKRATTNAHEIRFASEYYGSIRVIHLDVATHEGAGPSTLGHSIGHWEGKTLVIDTARFADHAEGNGPTVASGSQKHVLERLTPTQDGVGLTYHFEMADPEFLSMPIVGEVIWVFRPNAKFESEPCRLNNARHFLQH